MSAANKLADRRMYDLLVYGATGFTGQLVANYLAKNAPPSLRWGIAGRDEKKLQSIALELRGARAAAGQDSPLGVVIGSGTTIDNVAKAAKVVITTAGPYMLYGEPLLKACVEHGTDYCDLTGETLWLHHMLAKYGDQAKAKGVLIVPMSGFDSVPADLGTFFLVDYIRRQYGVRTGEVKGMMYGKGGISGGTIASALTMTVQPDRALALNPLFLVPEERGGPPAASIVDNNISDSPMIPRKNSILGKSLWEGYFIMSGVNSRIVRRSAVIFATRGHNLPTDSADTLKPLPILGGASTPAAGIDTSHVYSFAPFKYSESMIFGGWMGAWGLTIGLGIIAILSSIPGLINFVKQYLPQPGSGPSKEDLEKNNWFHYYLVGKTEEAVPRTVIARVRGGDGGYGETCKMLAEAGMSLALERASLPGTSLGGGFLTPSTCFGHRLVKRLQAADLVFEIVSTAGADSGDADTGHLRAGLKDRRPSPGDGAKLLKAGVF